MPRAHNIDKFGHCILCHDYLLKNIVVKGKQEAAFTPDKDEVWVKLNNGSMMSISVCKTCKHTTDFDDSTIKTGIFEALQNGWELEMDLMQSRPDKYPDFTPDKREGLERLYSSFSDYAWMKDFKLG